MYDTGFPNVELHSIPSGKNMILAEVSACFFSGRGWETWIWKSASPLWLPWYFLRMKACRQIYHSLTVVGVSAVTPGCTLLCLNRGGTSCCSILVLFHMNVGTLLFPFSHTSRAPELTEVASDSCWCWRCFTKHFEIHGLKTPCGIKGSQLLWGISHRKRGTNSV